MYLGFLYALRPKLGSLASANAFVTEASQLKLSHRPEHTLAQLHSLHPDRGDHAHSFSVSSWPAVLKVTPARLVYVLWSLCHGDAHRAIPSNATVTG